MSSGNRGTDPTKAALAYSMIRVKGMVISKICINGRVYIYIHTYIHTYTHMFVYIFIRLDREVTFPPDHLQKK